MVRKLLQLFGAIYLFYVAIAVLLVLPLLNTLPHWFVKNNFDRELHTDIVLFNPFIFAVEFRNASLPERDGSSFLAMKQARVDLSLSSLWHQGWVLDEVSVQELYLHVKQTEPGRFNFTDMLEAIPSSPPSEETNEPLPGLTIRKLALSAQRVQLTDQARDVAFTTHYEGLAVNVTDLSTIAEEGKPYKISAVAESGGQLNWEGTVSVPQASSAGKLTLSDISLAPLWRFAEPWLNLELQRGYLSLSGNYRLNWGEALSYGIDEGTLAINDISITPKDLTGLPDTRLALAALAVNGISLDSRKQHLDIVSVALDAPQISGWIDEDGRISLRELFAVTLPAAGPAQPEETEETSPRWTARLGEARLTGGEVLWGSPYTAPQQLRVSPLDAHFGNLNWPFSGESPLGLDLVVNGEASLAIEGVLALGPGAGKLQYKLHKLPVPWFNPNLPDALHGEFNSGLINIEGNVTLAEFLPSLIALSGAIEDFGARIRGEEDSLTSWNTVRLTELQIDMEQQNIQLARILIDNYEGRVHIAADGSVNASRVWKEEVQHVEHEARELAEELELDQPWHFSLPEIYVTDSRIDFMDESLPIPFRTIIGGLNGEILGITSESNTQASVDMKGSVDGYAPVALTGTAAPFKEPPALDLSLSFNGVDLSLLTPYSGTYAGHTIERGLLNLELEYALDNQLLQGNNAVVINQLKLGEKIDSDKAVDLPLELALALLTDANGVIDLEVPVSGNIEDPEFGLGSVISAAFINLITKAVTAPFSLLASLVGAEEDLQRLNFASGSAELRDSTRLKLDQLAGALEQRPGLTLVVSGRLNRDADLEHLQIAALNEELVSSGLTPGQIDKKDDAYFEAIARRYRQLAPDTELPAPPEQYTLVRQSIVVTDSELKELVQARAVAVKTYLVTEKQLTADRAAIEQAPLDDETHLFSGVELSLES